MKTTLKISALILLVILFGCKKEELPELSTTEISEITAESAVSGGNITSDGGADIIARGVCWSENENPTLSDHVTRDGNGSGSFTSEISGIKPAVKYYIRAYATNSVGTQYGQSLSFLSLGAVPQLFNASASYITLSGATLYGEVNPGDLPTSVKFEYGLTDSYGSSAAPSPYPFNGNQPTGCSVQLTNLTPCTLYHFRIISENELGVFYTGDNTFQTLGSKPSLTTVTKSLKTNSATITVKVNDNLLPVSFALEYGTTESLGNSLIPSESPLNLSSPTDVLTNLTGLTPGTKYFFRVKLTNQVGDTYSSVDSFTTYNVMDVDNNGYYSTVIGTQVWLTSNLKATHFNNGDQITNAIDNWSSQTTPAYCYYNNLAYYVPEGSLYNFYAAVDPRKVCPSGWHVPSSEEFTTLINYVGGISTAGPALRHTDSNYWYYNITVSTNITGFSATGSGIRMPAGEFWGWRHAGIFWTTSSHISDPEAKYGFIIYGDRANVELSLYEAKTGFNIRCLKD